MNIIKAFEYAYQQKAAKKWDCIYVAVDIHGTIFKPTYSKDKENYEYYPDAKRTLQMLSARRGIKLILWSASHEKELDKYIQKFEKDWIYFDYVNENPEVESTELASFQSKFYFNVGIDDKFGFEPEEDWGKLYWYFFEKAITR